MIITIDFRVFTLFITFLVFLFILSAHVMVFSILIIIFFFWNQRSDFRLISLIIVLRRLSFGVSPCCYLAFSFLRCWCSFLSWGCIMISCLFLLVSLIWLFLFLIGNSWFFYFFCFWVTTPIAVFCIMFSCTSWSCIFWRSLTAITCMLFLLWNSEDIFWVLLIFELRLFFIRHFGSRIA